MEENGQGRTGAEGPSHYNVGQGAEAGRRFKLAGGPPGRLSFAYRKKGGRRRGAKKNGRGMLRGVGTPSLELGRRASNSVGENFYYHLSCPTPKKGTRGAALHAHAASTAFPIYERGKLRAVPD